MNNPILRTLLAVLLSALSGLLLFLAFPPYDLWLLAWVAFIPLIIAQYRIIPRRISALAPAVTVGGWLGGYLYPIFAGTGIYMEWLPLIIFGINLVTEGGTRAFHERTKYRWLVMQQTAGWVGVELIRSFIPIAGTWGFLAYTQYRQIWLIQPVGIFTIFGLSALIMLVNYSIGALILRWIDSFWPQEEIPALDQGLVKRYLFAAGGCLGIWIVISLVTLGSPTGPEVKVAAIQPEASSLLTFNKGDDIGYQRLLSRMREQSLDAGEQGAELIVWPEGSLLFDPRVDDQLDLRGLTAETGSHLAVGYIVVTDPVHDIFRNEATVLNPQGDFLGVYGKDHPVTFGGETSPTRGTYPVYDTPFGKLATIICYDLDFLDTARKMARQGAQIIAVPSNDWGAIAEKHYTHVVFRAVENRVAIIKADGSFDSAIIDPSGRIKALAVSPQGEEATLVAEVAIGTGQPTLAARLGDWMGWLGLAGMVGFMVVNGITKRQE
jgi:apolipoprotein N-acyltransferase